MTARAMKVFDQAECLLILPLYFGLTYRLIAGYAATGNVGDLLLLPSEGLPVLLLLLRRRASEVSPQPVDWLLAFAGTVAPLLVVPTSGEPLLPVNVGLTCMLMGLFLQVAAKLALGRSFGVVAANRGLKLVGPYRYVRHPMYTGYILTHLGFLMLNATPWNLAMYAICDGLFLARMVVEERLLSRDPAYSAYCASVPYRVIPGLF